MIFCKDNDCPDMLQGLNRFMRMKHWLDYLKYYYKLDTVPHRLIPANVGHAGHAMILSPQGLCALFDFHCHLPGVLNATSDTPGIYEGNDFNIARIRDS